MVKGSLKTVILFFLLFAAIPGAFPEVPGISHLMAFEKKIECMAKNIYYEARGEGKIGMIAVAHVTVNRAKSSKFPSDVCEVVYQKGQFSWTKSYSKKRNPEQFEKAIEVAKLVLEGKTKDPTNGALYFHSVELEPMWNKPIKAKIGNHLFF